MKRKSLYSSESLYLPILAYAPEKVSLRQIDEYLNRPARNEPYIHKRIITELVKPGFVTKNEEKISANARKQTITKYGATHEGLLKLIERAYSDYHLTASRDAVSGRSLKDYLKLISEPFVWNCITSQKLAFDQQKKVNSTEKQLFLAGNQIPSDSISALQTVVSFVYESAVEKPRSFEANKMFFNFSVTNGAIHQKKKFATDLNKIDSIRLITRNWKDYEKYLPKLKAFYHEKVWDSEIELSAENMKSLISEKGFNPFPFTP